MKQLNIQRRKFVRMYEVIKHVADMYKSDGMFSYYLNKSLTECESEYNLLIDMINVPIRDGNRIVEFQEKKQNMMDDYKKENDDVSQLSKEQKYKDLVLEYENDIYEYDSNANQIGSFLQKYDTYTFGTIPYGYFPEEMDAMLFEFIYPLIEENVEILINKCGV